METENTYDCPVCETMAHEWNAEGCKCWYCPKCMVTNHPQTTQCECGQFQAACKDAGSSDLQVGYWYSCRANGGYEFDVFVYAKTDSSYEAQVNDWRGTTNHVFRIDDMADWEITFIV